MSLETNAMEVLRQTSRTFYLSIIRLPAPLKEAITSAYLSFRAIDEIEDHAHLDKLTKISLLSDISREYQIQCINPGNRFYTALQACRDHLPEVTNRLDEWMNLAPKPIAPRIFKGCAEMAKLMAYWVGKDWRIRTRGDLDQYTFGVAGTVGVLLSDLWIWYDGTHSRREDAIGFGRGLQAVNILRNRPEDLTRGVDFFPHGWAEDDIAFYARCNLAQANAYVDALPSGAIQDFCRTPLTLAYATLDALARGESKLSRIDVLELIGQKEVRLKTEVSSSKLICQGHSVEDVIVSCSEEHLGAPVCHHHRIRFDKAATLREMEEVILVNEKDEVVGIEEKIKAHLLGALHRAFSIFIFNSEGQLLLQKRTSTKYHSKGLWSNTCCGHPRFGESMAQASRRRLSEEMGFDCELREIFEFVYRAELDDGLTEHEYDHVLVGNFDGTPNPSRNEVDDWKWVDLPTLKRDLQENPEEHTYWFRIGLEMLIESMKSVEFSYMPREASSKLDHNIAQPPPFDSYPKRSSDESK